MKIFSPKVFTTTPLKDHFNRYPPKAGSYPSTMHTRKENTMKDFSNSIKFLASILIAVAVLSPSSQMTAWADVVAQPGYSIMLLNDELAGPVELDFDRAGNIFVANEGAREVFQFEDFVSKLAPTGVTLLREFIDNLEGSSGIAVDEYDNIYVSQDLEKRIRKYDPTGALTFEFESHRPGFNDPNTLTLTQDGRLLASVKDLSALNQWRIFAFDIQTGVRLAEFTQPFEFAFVNSIVYKNGHLFIGGARAPGSTAGPILIAEEHQAPVPYAYNNNLALGYVNGLSLGSDGTLFITDNTRLRKVSTDGSVTLLATGFEFARGLLAERDGCVLVADFRDGIEGALYRVCPYSKPLCTNVTANPSTLWPPNHKMVPVTITNSTSDDCNEETVCKVIEVWSNEPVNGLGDGDKTPDWEITDNLAVNLRAERAGGGTGRVYTMIILCEDTAGNSATKEVTVTVSHDQKKLAGTQSTRLVKPTWIRKAER
jgi:hypothetical protein